MSNNLPLGLNDHTYTHNFLNEKLANRAGLRPEQGGAFEVMVASGEKLGSSNKCLDVPITLQGTPIHVDFYLPPLEGYQVVLGAQWLRTLGPIVWDFSKLLMKFTIDGHQVGLHGRSAPTDRYTDMGHIAKKQQLGVLLQLYAVGSPQLQPSLITRDGK